jgi:hypothetical protein
MLEMTAVKWARLGWVVAGLGIMSACATSPTDEIAMVETSNAAATAAIISTLRQATGRQNISLGVRESDFDSIITVLPPPLGPYETRSLAVPEIFDVRMRNKTCFLVNRTTGASYTLNDVTCVIPPPLVPGSIGR